MNKETILKFINVQIKSLEREIKNIERDGTHKSMHSFGELNRLNGSRDTLRAMRVIIQTGEI